MGNLNCHLEAIEGPYVSGLEWIRRLARSRQTGEFENIEYPPLEIAQIVDRALGEPFAPKLIMHTRPHATSMIKKAWILKDYEWNECQTTAQMWNYPKIKYFQDEEGLAIFANDKDRSLFWQIKKSAGSDAKVISRREYDFYHLDQLYEIQFLSPWVVVSGDSLVALNVRLREIIHPSDILWGDQLTIVASKVDDSQALVFSDQKRKAAIVDLAEHKNPTDGNELRFFKSVREAKDYFSKTPYGDSVTHRE